MIVTPKTLTGGKLLGAIYDFPQKQDILPNHFHDDTTAHITIVARGSVKITAGEWVYDAHAGDVIDLPSNQYHEFVALEDNSRIVNIQKNILKG
jgi:quercetin dioxygenase-like cupin family protein